MKPVSVSELKARLSYYLREVRRGGEVQVLDRGVPVARLVGMPKGGSDDETRTLLVATGVLRPGNGRALKALPTKPLVLSTSLREALDSERADRL